MCRWAPATVKIKAGAPIYEKTSQSAQFRTEKGAFSMCERYNVICIIGLIYSFSL